MVENRFMNEDVETYDYSYWDVIDDFVAKNFSTIEISETFIIEY